MDSIVAAFLSIMLYAAVCCGIALVRAVSARKEERKQRFRSTFWLFFLETLNPLNWLT